MKNVVRELRELVTHFTTLISDIPEAEFSAKPLVNKWSKKEAMGHLISGSFDVIYE